MQTKTPANHQPRFSPGTTHTFTALLAVRCLTRQRLGSTAAVAYVQRDARVNVSDTLSGPLILRSCTKMKHQHRGAPITCVLLIEHIGVKLKIKVLGASRTVHNRLYPTTNVRPTLHRAAFTIRGSHLECCCTSSRGTVLANIPTRDFCFL
jgi:hypothetical protein